MGVMSSNWWEGYVQRVGLFASLIDRERAVWGDHFTCFWVHPDDIHEVLDDRDPWDGVVNQYMMNWLVISP